VPDSPGRIGVFGDRHRSVNHLDAGRIVLIKRDMQLGGGTKKKDPHVAHRRACDTVSDRCGPLIGPGRVNSDRDQGN
jgi:hypothetical protein